MTSAGECVAAKKGQILVAGYDNLAAAQEKLKSGELLCTIEQHPDLMGAYGVRCAVALLEGKDIPAEIAVPTDLITAESVGSGHKE
jgi:ABC-type sugar transport system substrate-binding protein